MTGDVRRDVGRWILAAALLVAGIGHLGPQRDEFRAQVPDWFPVADDPVVLVSGVIEIALGLALVVLVRHRAVLGWVVAGFFVAVFPGNIAQFVEGTDAFGLESDTGRFIRLLFQPLLVVWALWSTEAWRTWREGSLRPGRAG